MEIPSCMKNDEKLMVRIDLVRVCQDSTSFGRKMSIFFRKTTYFNIQTPKTSKNTSCVQRTFMVYFEWIYILCVGEQFRLF